MRKINGVIELGSVIMSIASANTAEGKSVAVLHNVTFQTERIIALSSSFEV